MKDNGKKKRNYNIDFLRGIATIWIIVIHTAWWSGTAYLPSWFSNIILIIDVPVFMFISGISFNFVNSIIKNLQGVILNWKKWIYFLIFYTLILLIFFKEQFILKDIFSWIVYVFPHSNNIEVVKGSIWFMIMYIKVTILCSIIICSINHFIRENSEKVLIIVLNIMLFIFLYCSAGYNFLFLDQYLSFYSVIYIFGYIAHNYKIKDIKQLFLYEGIIFIANILIFKITNIGINDIQAIKFPPTFPYLSFSLISITLFWYFKDNLKIKEKNIINYIGKNAIFFYFAQGVSSSFIYYIYKYIPFKMIAIKFIIMVLSNLATAIIIAIFLIKSYKWIDRKLTKNKLKKLILPTHK